MLNRQLVNSRNKTTDGNARKLLQEYTARPILVTKSFAAGVVLVRPRGLLLLALQTLN